MKPFFRHIALIFMLLLLPSVLHASAQLEHYGQWMLLPADSLVRMGSRYANGGQRDRALVCFSIVTDRLGSSQKKDEQRLCREAWKGKWYVYFHLFYDYPKALECLENAQELMLQTGEEDAGVYLDLGSMYQVIAEQSRDEGTYRQSMDYFKRAFDVGIRQGDFRRVDVSFTNMLTAASETGRMGDAAEQWRAYNRLERTDADEYTQYNKLQYQGLACMFKGRYAEGISMFREQVEMMPPDVAHVRFRMLAIDNMAKAYALSGDYGRAVACMEQNEQMAVGMNMRDCELDAYRLLAEYLGQAGQESRRMAYLEKYYQLKEELLNYRQVVGLDEVKLLRQMRQKNEQIAAGERKRRLMAVAVGLTAAVAVVVLVVLYVIYRKNRQLRQTNESLYQRNIEMLRNADEQRRRREEEQRKHAQLQGELDDLCRQMAQMSAAHESKADESLPKREDTSRERYRNSSLSQAEKDDLMGRILAVMDNTELICSVGFTGERLAKELEVPYKYISQVVNETCEGNFNTFLNGYRIREACKRMNDFANYGNYTIEAISTSVGFKARSAFINSFKKVTGLTPSEYQRIARSKNAG